MDECHADIEGNKVTVHHIRNCDCRTEMDFDVRHYDKTFDLERIRTAELFMVYWGSPKRMLLKGYGDELLYEHGLIATNLPLSELKRRACISESARTVCREVDFSRLIRQGVPGFGR